MLLLLLTTLSCAPQVATFPRPPVIVMPVVADTVAAATEFTFRALLVVSAACLAAMVVAMSTPFKYKGPASIMEDPMTAEPATSNDGALREALHTTLPAEIPSRSTLLLSAKLNVPDAGLIRAHVSSLNATMDELVNVACLFESAAVSPVTSDMATGPVDCCA